MLAVPHDRLREAIRSARLDARTRLPLAGLLVALALAGIVYAGIASAPRTPLGRSSVAVLTADGLLKSIGGRTAAAAHGGNEAPGYALLLTAMASVTPGTADVLACWAERREDCRASGLGWIVGIQMVVAAVSLWLVFLLAQTLSKADSSGSTADSSGAGISRAGTSPRMAMTVIATGLTFFAIRSGGFAGLVRGHIWYTFFLLLYMHWLLRAHERRDDRHAWLLAAASGAALGLAALLEPLAALLVPVSALQLFLLSRGGSETVGGPTGRDRADTGIIWLTPLAFLLAAVAAVLTPLWFAVANGYDPDAVVRSLAAGFSQRVAFSGLERSSLLLGLVQPVPLLGDLISGLLPASEIKKFSIGAVPGSLAHTGLEVLFPDALARAGGSGIATLALLFREYVIAAPSAYLASTPPVLMRGLFAGGGVIALAGLFHIRPMLRFAAAEGRLGIHLLVVVPVVTLLIANSLLTGNAFWLNPMLPFVYAYAIAYVAGGW